MTLKAKPRIWKYSHTREGKGRGLGKMEVIKSFRGNETVEKTVDQPLVPGAKSLIVPIVDRHTSTVKIDISFFDRLGISLEEGVRSFAVTDPETFELIETANVRQPGHEFWRHVSMELDYKGGTLREDSMKDLFMLALIKENNEFWFAGDDRPETLSNVNWVVEEVGSNSSNSTIKNEADFYRTVFNLSTDKKKFIVDVLGEETPDDVDGRYLEDVIIRNVNSDPTMTVFGDEMISDFISAMNTYEPELLATMKIVQKARFLDVFDLDEDGYYLDGESIGSSFMDISRTLHRNPKMAKDVVLKIKSL